MLVGDHFPWHGHACSELLLLICLLLLLFFSYDLETEGSMTGEAIDEQTSVFAIETVLCTEPRQLFTYWLIRNPTTAGKRYLLGLWLQ